MRRPILLALLASLAACQDAAGGDVGTRTQIRVVGSSTLYPFTTVVAEALVAADPAAKAPVIESTGTGAGLRLFCAGLGPRTPDIADASRRITAAEYRHCAGRGAGRLIEVPVGLDGIVVAESLGGPAMALTVVHLYRALAAMPGGRPNAARTWRDVDPALPATPIRVYGPPATSGTRDALAQLILARGCDIWDAGARAMKAHDPEAHRQRCTRLREDGAFIDAGENDNLVVQKLRADPQALGVVGFSYLEHNAGAVRGVALDGVAPDYASIADGRYPGSRPLYLYVKQAHLDAVPGLRLFLKLYAAAWGPGGPLVRRGLIPSPPAVRARAAAIVATEALLAPQSLH